MTVKDNEQKITELESLILELKKSVESKGIKTPTRVEPTTGGWCFAAEVWWCIYNRKNYEIHPDELKIYQAEINKGWLPSAEDGSDEMNMFLSTPEYKKRNSIT